LTGIPKETTNRASGRFIVGLVLASGALTVTYVVSERGDRGTPAIAGVLVGAVVCIALGRRSILAAVFCALVTLEFFVAPVLAQIGSDEPRVAPETVYMWLLAVAAGAMMGATRPRSTLRLANSNNGPIRWFALAVVCLMGAQAYLVLSGDQGYAAQIQGVGAPPSFLGTLSNVASVGVLAVCAMWQPGSISRSAVGALVVGEIALLVATGFRGSAPVFILAFIIVVVVAQRQHLRAVGFGKLAAVAVGLAVVIVGSFTVAAHLKTEAAVAQMGRTDIDFVWTADAVLPQLGQRLDLGPAFWDSSAYFSAVETPDVFSWSNQLIALIPRIFWHDKPIMDWGRQVTFYIYGSNDRTSSTISTLGDVIVNSGLYGVLIIGIVIGIGLNLIEQRVRARRAGPIGCIVFAIFVAGLFQQEQPLGLILASGLQGLVVLFLVWRVAVIMSAQSTWRRSALRMRPSNPAQDALT
jgi:hypothetical protein